MSQVTAVCFLLLGLALLLLDRSARWRLRPSEILAACAAILALLALVGYVYGVSSLYKVGPYASVALHTAVAFFALSLGVLTARTDQGMAALVLADTAGGHMARTPAPHLGRLRVRPGLRCAWPARMRAYTTGGSAPRSGCWSNDGLHSARVLERAGPAPNRPGAAQRRSRTAPFWPPSSSRPRTPSSARTSTASSSVGTPGRRGCSATRPRRCGAVPSPSWPRTETPDEMPDILGRVSRGERVTHHETVRVRKDGMRVDVSLSVSPVRDAAGRIVAASKIARDISSREKADEGAGGGPDRGRAGPGPARQSSPA